MAGEQTHIHTATHTHIRSFRPSSSQNLDTDPVTQLLADHKVNYLATRSIFTTGRSQEIALS